MPNDKRGRPSWIRYSSVGIEFASALVVFTLLGYWVDRHYESAPWGLVIGAALGLIGGTYNLIRESLDAFKQSEASDRESDGKPPAAKQRDSTKAPPGGS